MSGIAIMLWTAGAVRAADAPAVPAPPPAGAIQVEAHAEAVAEPGGKVQIIVNGQPVELKGETIKFAPEIAKLGKYWLGLMVGSLGDDQRKEMKVPEGQGLVVQQVVPGSPAAKAGFKEKDVLLKAGDKPLKAVEDLLAAVNDAKGKPLAIVLLREGKEQTIEVTPAKRPAAEGGELKDLERLFGHVEEMIEGDGKEGPRVFRFHAFGPGAILPPGAALPGDVLIQRPLPDDMSVTISKTGKKPAQITVKQGEENWEGTEEQLEEMPAKFRPHVDRMLGRLPMGIGGGMGNFNVRVMPPQPGEVVPKITAERILPAPLEQRIEKRFEQMNERIDKLFKMLEERRENAPRIRKTPKTDKTEGEKKPVDL
jgi:membrane-associated protease RseP (regulator of RpoE activity)